MNLKNRGFTLLELLIVIGVIAILSSVTVLVLNPAQILKRGRDSQRMADLASLQKAISLYLISASAALSDIDGGSGCIGSGGEIFYDLDNDNPDWCTNVAGSRFCTTTVGLNCSNGWLPINFSLIGGSAGGSPISKLPSDPAGVSSSATGYYYYTYKGNNNPFAYEFNANLESDYYAYGGSRNKTNADGGNNPYLYEVGNTTTLLAAATSSNFYGR